MLRLRLLGGFHIERAGLVEHSRLPSRSATLLLARLALQPHRQHPREELIELLWPGVALDVGRNRLRQTLSTLRALIETPQAPLLRADRSQVSLVPGALAVDALEFEAARADPARAALLYGGELLPGHFDDWVVQERHRLAALAEALPAPVPPAAVPPLPARPHALPSNANSLPRYLTRYFAPPGRLDALATQLAQCQLLTLVGPGGVGKTRLAVELAWGQVHAAHWRCGMAALAEVQDESGLVAALERALGITRGGGWPAIDAALREPAGLRLLILDNAEQALGIVAQAVQRLLTVAPALCVLVTSRHALELDGETLVDVAPLAPSQDATAQALFIDRARAVRADFHASRDNQAALAELIRELGGLPLALELAAARVRSFSPAQMLAQWRGHEPTADALPAWLANPNRPTRHASVAGLVDWSLALLGPTPRTLLLDLAALPGAFSLADVQALGGTPALLDELIGHSLVQAAADTEPRYALLELLRRALCSHADAMARRAARRRLRQALLAWATDLGGQAPITAWAPRREQARALIASAADDDDAATGLHLAVAMRPCWESDGVDRALVEQLGPLLRQAPSSAGHELRAQLAFTHGDRPLALASAEQALELAGNDLAARAPALVRRAWVLLAGDNAEHGQAALLDEAIHLARSAGDLPTEARAWQQQAAIAVSRGELAAAEALYARAQALWEQIGHSRQAAARLRNRAQCRIELGDVATALGWIHTCQQLAEAEGDGVGQLDAAYTLAMAHLACRDWPAALQAARQALRIAHARQHLHARALTLQLFPRPLAHLQDPERALQLAAFCEQHWQRHLGALGAREARALARARRLAAAQLPTARGAAAWAQGLALALPDALHLALGANPE